MYHCQQNKCYPQRCLLPCDNIGQICYCGQISLQSATVNCSFYDNLTPLEVTFILLFADDGGNIVYNIADWRTLPKN